MRNVRQRVALSGALVLVLAGCATTGGQTEQTIFDTHRRVVKLDNELSGTVTKLNETTAELSARVAATDEATRRIQALLEENQTRLEALERQVTRIMNSMFEDQGLTTGGAPDRVEIIPPQSRGDDAPAGSPARTPVPTEMAQADTDTGTGGPENMGPADNAMVEPPADAPAVGAAAASAEDSETAYKRAQRSYANEEYGVALNQFDQFLQRYPGSELAANARFWKAKCLLNEGRYRDAIGEFTQVRNSYPNHSKVPFAIHNQAVAHSRLGETQEAVTLLETVIAQFPANPAADQAKEDLQQLQGI